MTTTIKAPAILKKRTTKQLVEDFILTDSMKMTPELPIVRGWIMDELESRDPEAFNAWMDDEECTDESLRKYF